MKSVIVWVVEHAESVMRRRVDKLGFSEGGKMGKRATIWCEVSCDNCGGVIGFYYKNDKTISALKRKVRDWKYCGEKGNLCPDCYKKWKEKMNES